MCGVYGVDPASLRTIRYGGFRMRMEAGIDSCTVREEEAVVAEVGGYLFAFFG
jgi:hypothetical protein